MPRIVPRPEATPQLKRCQDQVDDAGQDVGVGQPGEAGVAVIELRRIGDRARQEVGEVGADADHREHQHDPDEEQNNRSGDPANPQVLDARRILCSGHARIVV